MKNSKLITTIAISSTIGICITSIIAMISYWLGYCNASDKYVNATECKPMRRLKFLQF